VFARLEFPPVRYIFVLGQWIIFSQMPLVANNNNNNNNWQKDFPVFRGSQRDELSLPEMFSAGAAFQRSFTAQQFAGL